MRPGLEAILFGGGDLYPGASLALDFLRPFYKVGGKKSSLFESGVLPGLTVSRNLAGYAETSGGILVPSPANQARITDKGLLVEEGRTNLLTRSQEFDNAAWTKSAATVTPNFALAPDGTLTADLLLPDTTSSIHRIDQILTISSGAAYTYSVHAKAAGYRYLFVNGAASPNQGQATFDLQAGTVSATATGSASIVALGNSWYRCIVTATSASTTNRTFLQVNNSGVATDTTFAADGVSGIQLWGAQLE